MKTAIVSDLHLGAISGGDVLRDPEIGAVLAAELRGADRLVLLGDAIELRERPVGAALHHARPALEALGAAVGEIEVILVPGNHDARLAEPLLDRLSIDDEPLALDATAAPSPARPPRSPPPSPPPACVSPTPASGCATTSTPPTATTWTCT